MSGYEIKALNHADRVPVWGLYNETHGLVGIFLEQNMAHLVKTLLQEYSDNTSEAGEDA